MKTVIASLSEVPETLHSEYESKDGKFVLKLEGDIPAVAAANAKVVEFRDKNVDLLKEVERLRPIASQFEGIDPTAAKDAIAKVKALGSKGINDINDFETRVRTTVDELVKPLREQVQQSANETAAERKRADEFLFRTAIADKFVKAGGKANAVDFVVGLAKDDFEVKETQVVAKQGKFSTEKPGDPINLDEWLTTKIQKDHDYVFEPSKGGGAPPRPGGTGGVPSKVKPGQTVIKNPTPQELGHYSADIAAGKVKVEYSPTT